MTNVPKQAAAGFLLACLFMLIVVASFQTMLAEDMLSNPSFTPTLTEQSDVCSPPENWVAITLQGDISLSTLATQSGLSEEALRKANCLARIVQPGDVIYIPPGAHGETPQPCGPPPGWRLYTVKEQIPVDDLAQRFGLGPEVLREANCFEVNITLREGERIFVPFPSVVTPAPTISPSEALTQEDGALEGSTPTITNQP